MSSLYSAVERMASVCSTVERVSLVGATVEFMVLEELIPVIESVGATVESL